MKVRQLRPIKETPSDYDAIEAAIREVFKKYIYLPLMAELGRESITIKNSTDDLIDAIRTGRIRFYRGRFEGKFNSSISKELRKIGAEWDRKQGSFAIPRSKLSIEVASAIDLSEARFEQTIKKIAKRLDEISPVEIAEKVKLEHLFDATLYKVNDDFEETVKGITVAPELTPHTRKRISEEYTKNLQLYIQDWTQKEIIELRKDIQKRSLAGLRYESMVKVIEKSYGVSQRKAKFLARQETSLMMTKFKQTRYEDAGVNEYKWGCVVGSPNHPVRPMHKALEGKIYRWDNPPIVDEQGNRKNPGQDYNCRCFAIPLVKF